MQLYPQVMYRALSELWEDGILSWRNHYQTNMMVEALISTSNVRLVEAALYSKDSASHTIQAIIDGYALQWNFESILHFLRNKSQVHAHYRLDTFVDRMCERAQYNIILEFLWMKEESEYYKGRIISELYKKGRKELANLIISRFFPAQEQEIIKITHSISLWEQISETQILDTLESLFLQIDDKDFSIPIMSHAYQLITALKNSHCDIDVLKKIFIRIKIESGKREKFSSWDYELEWQIRSHLLGWEKYGEALDFIEICWDRHHYKVSVLSTKMETGKLAKQDAEGTIREMCDILDEKIVKLTEERNKNLKDTKNTGHFWSNKHFDRVDLYEAHATRYSHLAIYELLYGSKQKADEYIAHMIEWVEKMWIPWNPKAPAQHKSWSMKVLKSRKRALRERFYHLGLLEHLPKHGGWSDTLQDPSLKEEKYEKKIKAKEQRQQNRESDIDMRNILQYTNNVLVYMRLLNEEKMDEALQLLQSETHYCTYTSSWKWASLILKKRPEAFRDIFQICTKNLKDSYRGTESLHGMEYFLLEAISLWSFEGDGCKEGFMFHLQRACHNYDRGMMSLPSGVIYHVVDTLIKKGETQKAWDFYNFLWKEVGKGWNWQIITDNAHDACMWLFIQAVSGMQGGGIAQSLSGTKQMWAQIEAIEYHNTELELAYTLGDTSKLQQHRDALHQSITTPLEAKKWVQLMTLGTLKNPKQRKEELFLFSEGDISQGVRWRMIDTMIDYKISDIFSIPELYAPETPKKILRYFFKKLSKNRLITLVSEDFLKDEYVHYLQDFFRKWKKYFDFIMDILWEMTLMDGTNGYKEIHISPRLLDAISETESFLQEIDINETSYQKDVYKNIFSCMLYLCEKWFLQEGRKQKLIDFLEYVDIGFFTSLCREPKLITFVSWKWDMTLEGFMQNVIKREVIGIHTSRSSCLWAMSTNMKTEKQLQDFFKRFILKKTLPGEKNHISQRIWKIWWDRVEDSQRVKNIQIVNGLQRDFFDSKQENRDYRSPKLESFDIASRKLVLYCRHHQISPVDFTVIYRAVSEYVTQSRSQIFDSVILVSRHPNAYYPEYLWPVDYRDVQGSDFMETCSVYANTMHLTHGRCPDNHYGSTPILSASIRSDAEKMKDVQIFIPLSLNLDPRNHIRSPIGEKVFDGDYNKMVDEVIRSIQALEKHLLTHIEKWVPQNNI